MLVVYVISYFSDSSFWCRVATVTLVCCLWYDTDSEVCMAQPPEQRAGGHDVSTEGIVYEVYFDQNAVNPIGTYLT